MAKPTVLVLGSGGREHAIVEAIISANDVGTVYCYPGNGGTCQLTQPLRINEPITHPIGLLGLAIHYGADLTIVGPEALLIAGIGDAFAKAGKLLLGPTKAAAALEGSKVFAKKFMKKYGIPTAAFDICSSMQQALKAALKRNWQCVIKADGLCGGKGVYVCFEQKQVEQALDQLMVQAIFGTAGKTVVVEDLLQGTECSYFVLVDGKSFVEFGTAGDHKRAFDNDEGPNTGGMGAFSPCPYVTDALRRQIVSAIVEPTVKGMQAQKTPFRGFLFIGLMLTAEGPKVLEYNVRLGDPEAQVILPRLLSSPYEIFHAAASGNLSATRPPIFTKQVTVGVNLVSGKYPQKEMIREEITGPITYGRAGPGIHVYHGATVLEKGKFYALGGRIFTIVAPATSAYAAAQDRSYDTVRTIHFNGMRYRHDIGNRAIRAQK